MTRVIGRGGMGVVYAAHDDRLDRAVAIKVIRPDALADDGARERFQREARAAASVSHPHICPLFEFDEDHGQPFLVMQLLDGESLAARIARGALPPSSALALAESMLDALAALHRRGIVHRDLKPANVFLTSSGLRLLDFGLAQPLSGDEHTRERLTRHGMVAGTPQYMAPEQLLEGRVDERCDIFAAGAVVYEMLAGRPAFDGPTLAAVIHAVGHDDPAPLAGPPEVARLDAVLRQALAKDPAARIARADLLASRLREAVLPPSATWPQAPHHVRPVTRFAAMPLRVLRPDAETDFLAFSVPDAVAIALANLQGVVVRSTQLRATADIDVRDVGRELGVDVVLIGTLLRSGPQVRVSAQLADAGAGTIIWSDVVTAPIDDLFQLQDTLTTHIVSSLRLPLSAADRTALDRQAPASAEAYALYLRANDIATDPGRWSEARAIYERSLAIDRNYAPAWARLGRTLRLLGKWGGEAGRGLMTRAEDAFTRAFAIDPDLSIAHDLAAYVEVELGRGLSAMERLLRRAARHRLDAGVFAGLVTTCRYTGLLDASSAAHDRASALDVKQATSVAWTYFMRGEYEAAIAADVGQPPYCALLTRLVRGQLAPDEMQVYEDATPHAAARLAVRAYRCAFAHDVTGALQALDALRAAGFDDPEGWYLYALCLGRLEDGRAPALALLARALDGGYACAEALTRAPEWNPLRGDPAFAALVERASVLTRRARERFESLDGPEILAVTGRRDDVT